MEDKIIKNVTFKSTPEYWNKECLGLKRNTVRKEDVDERMKRSTDDADAIIHANVDTPKSVKSRQAINYPSRGTV